MAEKHEDLSPAERAALGAWNRVSADTAGMLYAVRHALHAERQAILDDLREDIEEYTGNLANATQAELGRLVGVKGVYERILRRAKSPSATPVRALSRHRSTLPPTRLRSDAR